MRKTLFIVVVVIGFASNLFSQNDTLIFKTDASMFWKKTGEYVNFVESEDGSLYKLLGHHGPAIENLWVAYRIYFDSRLSVDILSKFHKRLELKTAKWYGNDSLKSVGYGMDNYYVAKTIGLGGIRLWDNDSVIGIDTKVKRTGEIVNDSSKAEIIITTYVVPYNNKKIDIEVKMRVIPDKRYATIEAKVLSGEKVRFVTGLTIVDSLKIKKGDNYILTWGDYNSNASSLDFNVGAAIIYDKKEFNKEIVSEIGELIVSKPTNFLRYYVVSANENELSEEINYSSFNKLVEHISSVVIE